MSKTGSKSFGKYKMRPLASIRPSQSNPRKHPQGQIDLVANAIKRFGFTTPLVIDSDGGIIAGEGRYLAAVQLALSEVPTIMVEGFSSVEKLGYLIADNKLGELADYDAEVLGAELTALRLAGVDMDGVGYDAESLRLLGATSGELDGAVGGEPQKLPKGTRWRVGKHTLALAGSGADSEACLMLCSPVGKHTIDYSHFKGGLAIVWMRYDTIHRTAEMEKAGFEIKYEMIVPDADGDAEYHTVPGVRYQARHMSGVMGKRKVADDKYPVRWLGGHKQTTVWSIDDSNPQPQIAHIDTRRRCITNHVPTGGRVFDPQDSTGGTMVAAEMDGRLADVIVVDMEMAERVVARLCRRIGKVAIRAI